MTAVSRRTCGSGSPRAQSPDRGGASSSALSVDLLWRPTCRHTKPGIAQGQEIPLSSSSLDSGVLLRTLEKEVGTEAAARQSLPAAHRASLLHRVIFAPVAELPFVDVPEIRRYVYRSP